MLMREVVKNSRKFEDVVKFYEDSGNVVSMLNCPVGEEKRYLELNNLAEEHGARAAALYAYVDYIKSGISCERLFMEAVRLLHRIKGAERYIKAMEGWEAWCENYCIVYQKYTARDRECFKFGVGFLSRHDKFGLAKFMIFEAAREYLKFGCRSGRTFVGLELPINKFFEELKK